MVVSLWLDPFRLDVHRTDGSAVVETAAGRRGPLLDLRDAERRVHDPPPMPPGGRDLRPRREDRPPEPQGPGLHAVEHRRARPGRDRGVHRRPSRRRPARGRARASSSTRTTSRSRSSTTRRYPDGAMAGSFVDNGYRGDYDFSRTRGVPRSTSPAASTPSTSSPGRGCPTSSRRTPGSPGGPRSRRCGRWATTSAAGSSYTQDAVEALAQRHRDAGIPCDALWLDIEYMDGYRVFTWNTEAFPGRRPACWRGWPSRASGSSRSSTPASSTTRATGCSTRRSSATCCAGPRAATSTSARSGPATPRFPDFVTEEARAWWGELNAAHVQSGLAGIWNDMNEPATGTRSRPTRCASTAAATPTSASTTSTRC